MPPPRGTPAWQRAAAAALSQGRSGASAARTSVHHARTPRTRGTQGAARSGGNMPYVTQQVAARGVPSDLAGLRCSVPVREAPRARPTPRAVSDPGATRTATSVGGRKSAVRPHADGISAGRGAESATRPAGAGGQSGARFRMAAAPWSANAGASLAAPRVASAARGQVTPAVRVGAGDVPRASVDRRVP
jgi:hypothetical protein